MKTTMLILTTITFIAIGLHGSAQEEKEEVQVFFKLDTMPEYPGGMGAFLKDVTTMVKYPEEASKQNITGKIYVGIIVDTSGKAGNVSIARGLDPLLDIEALRVINQLKKTWKPGIKDGKAVNAAITVLFDFKEDKTIDVSIAKPSR